LIELSSFLIKFDTGLKQSGTATIRLVSEHKISNEIPREITSQMDSYALNQLDAAGQRTDINNLFNGLSDMGEATTAFAEAGAIDASQKGQVLGDAIQIAGVLTGNPPAIAAGEVISDVSSVGLTLLSDQSSEKKVGELLYTGAKRVVLGSRQGLLNKFEKAGDLEKTVNNVLRGINYTYNKISDIVKDKIEKDIDEKPEE